MGTRPSTSGDINIILSVPPKPQAKHEIFETRTFYVVAGKFDAGKLVGVKELGECFVVDFNIKPSSVSILHDENGKMQFQWFEEAPGSAFRDHWLWWTSVLSRIPSQETQSCQSNVRTRWKWFELGIYSQTIRMKCHWKIAFRLSDWFRWYAVYIHVLLLMLILLCRSRKTARAALIFEVWLMSWLLYSVQWSILL